MLPLTALFVGYALACNLEILREFSIYIFIFGIAFLILFFQCKNNKAFLFLSFVMFFCAHFFARVPANPYPDWKISECLVEGEITTLYTANDKYISGILSIEKSSKEFEKAKNLEISFLAYHKENIIPEKGDYISLKGAVSPLEDSSFDKYLKSKNIFFKIKSYTCLKQGISNAYVDFFNRANAFIKSRLYNVFPFMNDAKGMFSAIILGDKSGLAKSEKNSFARTGTLHIFAISGMHVAMLAAILYFAFALLRFPLKARVYAALPILFLYVEICQGTPSARRAFIMIFFFGVSLLMKRKSAAIYSLIAAALFTLILNPLDLFEAGFSLSYVAVASILLFALPLNEYIWEKTEPYKLIPHNIFSLRMKFFKATYKYILISLVISYCAFVANAILSAHYFSYIAPMSIVYSVPFVFFTSVIVSCGLLALILPASLAIYTNTLACYLLDTMRIWSNLGAERGMYIEVYASALNVILTLILLYIACALLKEKHKILLGVVPSLIIIISLSIAKYL